LALTEPEVSSTASLPHTEQAVHPNKPQTHTRLLTSIQAIFGHDSFFNRAAATGITARCATAYTNDTDALGTYRYNHDHPGLEFGDIAFVLHCTAAAHRASSGPKQATSTDGFLLHITKL
jgi:hypothetical protein